MGRCINRSVELRLKCFLTWQLSVPPSMFPAHISWSFTRPFKYEGRLQILFSITGKPVSFKVPSPPVPEKQNHFCHHFHIIKKIFSSSTTSSPLCFYCIIVLFICMFSIIFNVWKRMQRVKSCLSSGTT